MMPEQILAVVRDTPHTPPDRGRQLYDFILEHRLGRCLELGFAHGVGTVWMAGAAKQLGGKVVGVDRASAVDRKPPAKELVAAAGLEPWAELHFDPVSYTWHLQRKLEEYIADPFDLIFIDGAHTWDVDGFAFFLCERILKPGGWILFDDLEWNYRGSPAAMAMPWVQALTDEEKNTAQVMLVWEKLVTTHPGFSEFVVDGSWGWTRKAAAAGEERTLRVVETKPHLMRRVKRKLGL